MWQAEPRQFRIEKAEVEWRHCARSVGPSPKNASKSSTISANLGLSGKVCQSKAVDTRGVVRDIALGVDQRVEMAAGRQIVEQFQRCDFDDPVAEVRFQASGLRVEQNGSCQAKASP